MTASQLLTRKKLPGGWETGNPNAIKQRYGGMGGFPITGNPATTANPVIGGAPSIPSEVPTMVGGFPMQPSAVDNPDTMERMPAQNSMQRQQAAAQEDQPGMTNGLKPISDARRFFWATGRIDARAPQADPSQNKNFVSQRPNMDAELSQTMYNRPAETWAQRQAKNKAKLDSVREMRGLSPY